MSDEPTADLSLIAHQQRILLGEMGTLHDDMSVLTAVVQHLDGKIAGLVNEIRATHSQQSCRVREPGGSRA